MRRLVASHIPRPLAGVSDDIVHRPADSVGMLIEAQMPQQHAPTQDQCRRVCLVFPLDIQSDVSTPRLKDRHIPSHITARHNPRTAYQSRTNIRQDATVKIRHDQHIKLLRPADTLHASIIDNHIIRLQGRKIGRHRIKRIPEQAIRQLHDIRLVHTRHLLPIIREGKRKRKFRYPLALRTCDDLQRLHDPSYTLVFEA